MTSAHAAANQAPPLVERDLLADDQALLDAIRRHGAHAALPRLHELGAHAGSERVQQLAVEANVNVPVLRTHDRYGNRVDEVSFHPAWHELMTTAVETG
ncbi:MAG TPA: DNA alkylation response protein, partial [Jiangellaceae bacterium]